MESRSKRIRRLLYLKNINIINKYFIIFSTFIIKKIYKKKNSLFFKNVILVFEKFQFSKDFI